MIVLKVIGSIILGFISLLIVKIAISLFVVHMNWFNVYMQVGGFVLFSYLAYRFLFAKSKLIVSAITIVIGIIIGISVISGFVWWKLSHPPKYVAYNVEHEIVVFNPADSVLKPHELFIKIPMNNERQKARFIDLKPETLDVVREDNLLKVTGFEPVAPGEELEVIYSYKVKIRENNSWRNMPVDSTDLKPEPDIESNNVLIHETAEKIVAGVDNPRAKVRALFNYVEGEIDYAGIVSYPSRSALECLKNKSGVCGHKANLLTALCRSVGIPARTVFGITLPTSENERHKYRVSSHGWNEIYIAGEGWYFADPTIIANLSILRELYWDEYRMFRASIGYGTNITAFSTEIANLPSKIEPNTGMSGPPCFLFTCPKGSDTFHYKKVRSKAVRIREGWEEI